MIDPFLFANHLALRNKPVYLQNLEYLHNMETADNTDTFNRAILAYTPTLGPFYLFIVHWY